MGLAVMLIVFLIGGLLATWLYRERQKQAITDDFAAMTLKREEMNRILREKRLDLDKEGEDYEKIYREFTERYGATTGNITSKPSDRK